MDLRSEAPMAKATGDVMYCRDRPRLAAMEFPQEDIGHHENTIIRCVYPLVI